MLSASRVISKARALPANVARMSGIGRGTPVLQSQASIVEEAKSGENWRSISFAGLAVVGGMGAYIFANLEHPHFNPKDMEFRNVRNKDFPWGNGKTSLFGLSNDPEVEAEATAKGGHH
eukprot:TRINITY_DN78868_c0_g1_i1.p2 TRINITY_DN78868_c0_g1~~TRINITY_DN78868_c0_g1_i1.p2  ORF type:complete len:119 (-),score=21.48 TRINITY_DN78868_c0_g1_i1:49-405(-)